MSKSTQTVSPENLRKWVKCGLWKRDQYRTVQPPEEWPVWRQKRFSVALDAAILFIVNGMPAREIRDRLATKYKLGKDISKQRMGQYIKRGTDYIVENGILVRLTKGGKAA